MKKKDFALGILCGAMLFSGATAMAAGITAEPTWQNIYVDGQQVAMTAYNIAGSNYVKLRDIGQQIGFNVYWLDGVQIDTDAPYTGVVPAQEANELPTIEEIRLEIIRRINEVRRENGVSELTVNQPLMDAAQKCSAMLGHCEVWTAERAPAVPPVKQTEVPWEILRPGTRLQDDWEEYIDKIVECKPRGQQAVIRQRHEHLWHMTPDFCVLGSQNFWGYVVYGFTALNLYVFECNEINNATYVFKGDWESASQLTKTEVLSGHVQEARIYHTEKWYENTGKLIARAGKEAV